MKNLKAKLINLLLFICIITGLIGCGNGNVKENVSTNVNDGRAFYEIFVRSFNDSNGDGIGDLNGVTEKLDYLEDLGIKGIWLMPINASGSYHGYDVDDYYSINKDYGTMEDFEKLLEEAHKRDIKIVMDLVINHTSINNKWFLSAKDDPKSEYRDYYIWTNDMKKINEISPMNTKAWSQNGDKDELYYSIFWSGMPDLNMDNPKVVQEVKDIAKFYLDKGIDGFRLDAAKWVFNDTSKNTAFWTDFNNYVKSINSDSLVVGEVWDSTYNEAAYANSLDSLFEFSIGECVTDRIHKYSIAGFPGDYESVNEIFKSENEEFIIAPFLRNHDQNRIGDTFTDTYTLKVAAAMYLTLPGTPYIYYGEETGMTGSGADENKRQPFIWDNNDTSKNTSWEKSNNNINKVAVSVQEKDEESLLSFYKDILNVRNSYEVLRFGTVSSVDTDDSNIMAMKREYNKKEAYVIVNGNDDKGKASIPKGKYDVVYSNKDKEKSIKSSGELEIDNKEITILIKK